MPDVTLAIDGGALVAGLGTMGATIGGGIVAAVKLLISYQKSKDASMNKLVDRFLNLSVLWQNESRETTAALTQVRDGLTQLVGRFDRLEPNVIANKRP